MKKKGILKQAIINSTSTALYVAIVITLVWTIGHSSLGNTNTILAPIAFLMLFVFSAALTGFLV